MSSDSGQSHSSAHNDNNDAELGARELESFDQNEEDNVSDGTARVAKTAQNEDVESISSGTKGLTFARTRRSFPQQFEDESASEASLQVPRQRPRSLESTSTPDDTPSIQVLPPTTPIKNVSNSPRALVSPPLAVYQYPIPPYDRIDLHHYSPLNADFLLDYPRHH